jgi:hypothetical protein
MTNDATRINWACGLRVAWAMAIVALLAATSVRATEAPTWSPSEDDISKMEPKLRLPANSYDLSLYARYYSGVILSGHHIIKGYLVKGFNIIPGKYLGRTHDIVMDGGCSVVKLDYDADDGRTVGIFCNGRA